MCTDNSVYPNESRTRDVQITESIYCTLFIGILVYSTVSSTFGHGSGPIFLTNIHCSGSETSLLNCSKTVFTGHSCTHEHDVGVRCERKCCLYI